MKQKYEIYERMRSVVKEIHAIRQAYVDYWAEEHRPHFIKYDDRILKGLDNALIGLKLCKWDFIEREYHEEDFHVVTPELPKKRWSNPLTELMANDIEKLKIQNAKLQNEVKQLHSIEAKRQSDLAKIQITGVEDKFMELYRQRKELKDENKVFRTILRTISDLVTEQVPDIAREKRLKRG